VFWLHPLVTELVYRIIVSTIRSLAYPYSVLWSCYKGANRVKINFRSLALCTWSMTSQNAVFIITNRAGLGLTLSSCANSPSFLRPSKIASRQWLKRPNPKLEDHPLSAVRDCSVGTALGCGLDDRGSRVRFPAGDGNFSLHHLVQNGSGAHPASYPIGTRGSFPGDKAAGAWSWPLTSI
jgi:hypothetical protein